jgi:hypothetical protein
MSGFDGNGNFVRPYNWANDATNNIPITASRFDTDGTTVQAAFNLCLTRDNQGKPTTALSWLQTLTLTPASGVALRLNGVANTSSEVIVGSSTSGQSFGLTINAGTTTADYGLLVASQNGATNFLSVAGNGVITVASNTAIAAGGSVSNGISFTNTSAFGVFTGSGVPTISAAKGSLYLRSDGSTTTNRAYINTDGATTWTAVTTAA